MIDDNIKRYLCKNSNYTIDELTNHLDRLEKVEEIANSSQHSGLNHLKYMYYRKYLISPCDIPKKYLINNFGSQYIDIGIDDIISLQKSSLDMWLDYLLCKDVIYPQWFKFFIFQGIVRIGAYDEVKGKYNKRTKTTIAPFVEIDYEIIAFIYNNLSSYLSGYKLEDEELEKIIESGNFNKLYSYCEKVLELKYVRSLEDLEKVKDIDRNLEILNKKLVLLEEEKRGIDKFQKIEELWHEVLSDIYLLKDMKNDLVSLVKYNNNIELRKSFHNKYNYSIYLRGTNEYVGKINYRTFHTSGYLGDVGYSINKEFRGNGYALQALELLSEKLYEDNIPNFYISTYESNIASKKTIEKYGGKISSIDGNVLIYTCDTRLCNKVSERNK